MNIFSKVVDNTRYSDLDASADIRRLDGGFARDHFGAGIQKQKQEGISERFEGRGLFQRRRLPSADQDHQAELRQAGEPSAQSGFVRVVGIPMKRSRCVS